MLLGDTVAKNQIAANLDSVYNNQIAANLDSVYKNDPDLTQELANLPILASVIAQLQNDLKSTKVDLIEMKQSNS